MHVQVSYEYNTPADPKSYNIVGQEDLVIDGDQVPSLDLVQMIEARIKSSRAGVLKVRKIRVLDGPTRHGRK